MYLEDGSEIKVGKRFCEEPFAKMKASVSDIRSTYGISLFSSVLDRSQYRYDPNKFQELKSLVPLLQHLMCLVF